MEAAVKMWGNSLAVRLPREVTQSAQLLEGTKININVEQGNVVLKKARPSYTLDELLDGMDAEKTQRMEFGGPVGKEAL
jgi:antitoxin MazE